MSEKDAIPIPAMPVCAIPAQVLQSVHTPTNDPPIEEFSKDGSPKSYLAELQALSVPIGHEKTTEPEILAVVTNAMSMCEIASRGTQAAISSLIAENITNLQSLLNVQATRLQERHGLDDIIALVNAQLADQSDSTYNEK